MASLSREKADEICQHIRTNPDALFGQKYWQCRLACVVQAQQKAEKWETRFLAIAKFRVFLLNGKSVSNIKLEKSFNVLALRNLELLQQEQVLQIGWEDKPGGGRSSYTSSSAPALVLHLFVRKPDGAKTRDLALDLLATLKHYFPEVQKSLSRTFISLGPPSLLSDFSSLPLATPELPCRNFRRSYVAYCDWMEQPFRDEVIWDIERIYFFHGQHELDLNDFSHLSIKDQLTLIGSIQFSGFFTGIFADSIRLQAEHVDALLLLIRRTHSLRSLHLNGCTLPKDFLGQLSAALLLNMSVPLERIRFVGIAFDDKKGLGQLATLLPQLRSLKAVSFSDCLLNEKCALALLHGLHHGIRLASEAAKAEDSTGGGVNSTKANGGSIQLEAFNLSGNSLGTGVELSEQLSNFLALNTGAISFLDLSGTGILLDRLWSALKLGGLGLEVLRLGGCQITSQSKRNNRSGVKDCSQVARELFAAFLSLKELDLTATHLSPELLFGILSGLAANSNLPLSSLSICLDNCLVGPCSTQFISALEQYLAECSSICSLSLRDNSLEHESFRLLPVIGQMKGIRLLDIGGTNFLGLKVNKKHAQMLGAIMTELVKLINGDEDDSKEGDETSLEELSLSDSRLGSHLSILLNALGLSRTLLKLNLSNCDLGPGGARLLGKSLQLNQSIRQLSLDRNQIGADGFFELARALRLNTTLLHLEMPVSDLADSLGPLARSPLERARLITVVGEVEGALKRNIGFASVNGRPNSAQLSMRTLHLLNNNCDRYDINGPEASEIKKIAFHKIDKLVAQIGEQQQQAAEENLEKNKNLSFTNGEGNERMQRLVEGIAERVEQLVEDNNKIFFHSFTEQLNSQEGVEVKNFSNNNVEKHQFEQQKISGDRLRRDLMQFIAKFANDCAWSHLFTQLDQALSASNDHFRIIEQNAHRATISRRGILLRSPADAMSSSSYRPNSAIMSSELQQHQQNGGIAGVMSKSVLGNISWIEEGDEKQKASSSSKLVHLAKHRPKPARFQRKVACAATAEEVAAVDELDKVLEGEEEDSCPSEQCSSDAIMVELDGGIEVLSASTDLERLQHHKNAGCEEENESSEALTEFVADRSSSTPPNLPATPKKDASRENLIPPKLPPKPSPPTDLKRKQMEEKEES